MPLRSYSILLFVVVTLCILTISGFNALIDPYRLFNTSDIAEVNKYRNLFFYHQFLAKPYALKNYGADAIILGSSRAGSSLATDHPGWNNHRVYNYALAGSSTFMNWRSYQHAKANGDLKRVLITLDFYMYNSHHQLPRTGIYKEYEERLSVTESNQLNLGFPLRWFEDVSVSLLTFGTVRDSWTTLLSQSRIEAGHARRSTLTPSGFWINDVPPNMPQRELFRVLEKQYMTSMWFPDPDRKFSISGEEDDSKLVYLRKILSDCYAEGIEVTLVFMPFHARLSEAMRAVDVWTLFEQWKKKVIVLNEDEADAAARYAYPVWDFTGYNSITTEPVPPMSEPKARMHWHIDATHVSKAAGDLMQDQIWGSGFKREIDFGRKVDSRSIDTHLREINAARVQYSEMFPDDVLEVSKIARRTASWRRAAL